MSLTVAFTATQTVGSPQNIVITDITTGSDVSAVSRRIYITNAANAYITAGPTVSTSPAYTSWALAAGSSLTLNVLSQDSAYNITLEYVDINGNVVASDIILEGFTLYNESFYYSLTQAQAQQNQPPPNIIQDSNYYMNKGILRTEIDSGNQALSLGSDIKTAQGCYDRATYMVSKQADNF